MWVLALLRRGGPHLWTQISLAVIIKNYESKADGRLEMVDTKDVELKDLLEEVRGHSEVNDCKPSEVGNEARSSGKHSGIQT